jgi:hypothetical protein
MGRRDHDSNFLIAFVFAALHAAVTYTSDQYSFFRFTSLLHLPGGISRRKQEVSRPNAASG